MEKLNLVKQHPAYYKAQNKPVEVEIEPVHCLTISGIGAPEEERFQSSVGAIYAVAYTVKKYAKSEQNDFVVPKMEAFWWVDEGLVFDETPKSDWQWQLMIRMPDLVSDEHVDQAVEEVIKKKGICLANEVQLKAIHEGRCVQVLHVGSYYEEGPSIKKILEYMKSNGLEMNGYHHEIYLSDPTRTAVEKLKTIIRYAVK
ncbi:GyrI-like domain-containing protein [Reichenbachiella carrageenanivorans]|uniref:GyrI-like domain-containing protein n=1 Tax=Reichenbachiella carrageenanivorans TaxID=2979869 RepID=A0ABY6CV22_9BACT|nr:GyrI-like domain-containing protein [Reichenbachiella carrageenanivorans]UXX77770.1 GyrI-like domain-containing protein [Reichenbachiella carrageenanivorans]